MSNKLLTAVNRVSNVVGEFESALFSEFYPCRDTVRDWWENINLLTKGSRLIQSELSEDGGDSEDAERYGSIRCSLNQSLNILASTDRSADAMLVEAWYALTEVRTVLSDWESHLENQGSKVTDYTPPEHFYPSEKAANALADRYLEKLDFAVMHSSDVYVQCMASRKAFLTGLYTNMIYHKGWNLGRFLTAQSRLLRMMPSGTPYYRSVQNRTAIAKQCEILNPESHQFSHI